MTVVFTLLMLITIALAGYKVLFGKMNKDFQDLQDFQDQQEKQGFLKKVVKSMPRGNNK